MVAEFTVISGKIRENFRALHGMTWSEAQKNEARTMMQQLITAPVHSEIVGDRMRDFRTVGEKRYTRHNRYCSWHEENSVIVADSFDSNVHVVWDNSGHRAANNG